MELRTFIKTTLIDIIGAIKEAQEELGESVIIPGCVKNDYRSVEHGISPLQAIDFEVSVEADKSKGSEGKLGIVSSLVSAGVAGKKSVNNRQANIIKFRIPVCFPISGPVDLEE